MITSPLVKAWTDRLRRGDLGSASRYDRNGKPGIYGVLGEILGVVEMNSPASTYTPTQIAGREITTALGASGRSIALNCDLLDRVGLPLSGRNIAPLLVEDGYTAEQVADLIDYFGVRVTT